MKLIFLYSLTFFIFSFLAFCSPDERKNNSKNESSPTVSLLVSKEKKEHLLDIQKDTYSGEEVSSLFQTMREKSDTVCEMVYGKKKYDETTVKKFINPNSFSKPPFKSWGSPIPKLIAGCWNFFKLNDTRPDIDFHYVNSMYQNKTWDCYSVGFLQPYLMHSIFGCSKLTTLDMDWRIADAHLQMIELFKKSAFKNKEDITENIKTLDLHWTARFDDKPMEKKSLANLRAVCYSEFTDTCYNFLQKFQATMSMISSINLFVASLHEPIYKFTPNTTPVFFLSNATEDFYTSQAEFNRMMDSINAGLEINQSSVFIHHAAGRAQFGIYELKKISPEKYEIESKCRDRFMSSPVGDMQHPYLTYFDKISINQKTAPICAGLMQVNAINAKKKETTDSK